MRTHPLVATAILNLVLAVFLYSCTTEDNSPGGGGVDLALQGETYLDEVTAEQTINGTAIAVSWITKPIFNNDWRVTGYRITLTDNSDNPITVDVPAGTGTEYSRDILVSVGSYRVAVVVQVLDTTTDTAITTTPVSAGTVEVVDEAEAPAPPPAPTLASGNDTVGRGQLTVTWDAPGNTGKHVDGSAASITNYTLYWKRGEMPSSTDYNGMVTVADIEGRSYIITNLDSGNYHVAIASMNSAGLVSVLSEVAESPEVVDTTTLGETYLDGVTAASTDKGKAIQVSWTAKTPPAGRTVTGYTIILMKDGEAEPITFIVPVGTNSEYSTEVTAPSGRYEVAVTVRVRDTVDREFTTSPVSAGEAEITNAAEAPTPPPAPTLVVSNDTVGRGQITVTWSSPTNTGKDIEGLAASITSYTLYWKRGEPPSSTDYDGMAIIADVGNRSYIITNLDSGIYHVAVASRNSAGLGSILSVVTESPEVVDTTTLGETYLDNLTAISTDEGRAIQVSWTAKTPPAGRRVTGYTITLTDNSDAKITESVPASTETVYSKDIKASIGSYGVAVTVRVTVGDREFITSPVDGGIAAITNGSEFPVPPLAPTLKVGNDDNARGQLTVTWSSPTNTGKNIDGSVASITNYTLYWKRGEAPSSTNYDGTAMVSNTQGRSYIITNLDSGIYHVAIASMNSAGLGSVLSEVAESPEVVDATTLGETYLDNLTVKSTPDGTAITVSWTAKTPPAGRTVTGYTITLTNSGDPEITEPVLAGTNSEYSRDIKASIGSYRVAVTVRVTVGDSEFITSPVDGGVAEITSEIEAPTPPPAPRVVEGNDADGWGQLTITWDAPANAGKHIDGSNATITGYTLYWKEGAAPSSTDYDGTVTVADVQDRSYTIGRLDTGTYHVAVVSENSAGLESPLSVVTETVVTAILIVYAQNASLGDTTLTIRASTDVRMAVTDDAALLAGIIVNRIPLNSVRETNNLATAATLVNNNIVITISDTVTEEDEFIVQLEAGLIQDDAGYGNGAVELSVIVEDITTAFGVANLVRSTATSYNSTFVPDNHRTHFVTFGIRSGTAGAGEYRLGLKAASKTAPTVSELTNARAAITRTLTPKRINIYLPFHIEGTYFDTGVTQDYATASATVLSPATSYTLYITPADGSGAVEKLLDITTDAVPTTTDWVMYGLPPSIYEYTVREQEATILKSLVLNGTSDNEKSIEWLRDGIFLTACFLSYTCTPQPSGFTFYPSNEIGNKVDYIAVISNPSGSYETRSALQAKLNIKTGRFIMQPVPAE